MKIAHSHILLDACCLLNFCASGNFLAILQALPAQLAVTQDVKDELQTLQCLENEENEGGVQFQTALDRGLLIIVDFESEEEAGLFVNYAAALENEKDGDAATCAIGIYRRWATATDDKKVISFVQREAPHLQILSTPEIIKHWSEEASLDSSALCDVLNAIQVKGCYVPPKSHPLRTWWEAASTDVDRRNS